MKLIESYSLNTGLKIQNPFIYHTYFPLNEEKYIVFHFSGKDNLRDYKYWALVIEQLKPYFAEYKFIQVGVKEDPTFPGIDRDLRGHTNLKQTAYIIKNCNLFIGVDSFPIHLAGYYKKKCIGIYSNSYKSCVEPVWGDKSLQRLMETHRLKDEKPSFSFHEQPKTVDRINPEEIVKNSFELMDIEPNEKIESIYIGDKFNVAVIDVIPNSIVPKQFNNNVIPFIRRDLATNQNADEILYNQLYERKCSIITNKTLDISILKKLRNNLQQIIIEINDDSMVEFVKSVHFTGINYVCITYLNNEEINKFKLNYSDYNPIIKLNKTKKIDFLKNDEFRNQDWSTISDFINCRFKSNKFLLSDNKIYLGQAYWKADKPLDKQAPDYPFEFDNDDFWSDGEFYYLFRKTPQGLKNNFFVDGM